MNDTSIIAVVGFMVSMIAVITPIVKLNTTIAKLTAMLDHILQNDAVRDRRLNAHRDEIAELRRQQGDQKETLVEHDVRLKTLEKED